ncbi:methyl-accepting chemotaxis protein [Rhizobium oryzicola]|uniref:Methyl-accepting chemotaxis protein n=1 Tax=Rhizobium oryzicola TaxID=1232668 RepID=A0ABT8SZE2_9HYPH|nr:methyl-accepting chemotaxis protein [Rhizobium oryzicola]MDO1583368.1 methyl-accepting chemotaxis protein [Rhizobium oryzicola]
MTFFQNIKIITKISTVIISLIVVSLIVSFVSYTSSSTQTQNANWTDHTYQVLDKVSDMMAAMVDQETGMRGYLVAADQKFLEPQIAGAKAFQEAWAAAKKLTSDNPAQQARLDEVSKLAETWNAKVVKAEMEFMKDPATIEKARQIEISGAGKASMDGIRAKVKELADAETSLLSTRKAALESAGEMAKMTALAGGIAMLVISGLGLLVLNGSLVKPLRALNDCMLSLVKGQNDVTVPGRQRKDELGDMSAAVETFRQTAIAKIESDRAAAETRNMTEAERARAAEVDAKRATEMAEATSGLAEGLKQLAGGNLGFELSRPFASDFEGLRNDFNLAVSQLRDTLSSVAEATRSIDSGSRELSSSANDLSKRTEQQAASLEETAAALDEITTNVTNSSKRTEEARSMAMDANKSARQSGEVVANAVNAMQRIEASSSQISNIIGVIDEIAFQTNLLALNAGVEAARAGEAGKGFAVVAQEVRELAQRSAQAAKEIKDLIRTSADEVENGVKLVTATGEALKVIEDHVVAINGQLDAIATSAREQSVGLSEVNTAVNQMDQTTQQNAAMVEQATAASATLAGEADKLRQLVGRFQLSGGSASGYGHGGYAQSSAPVAASNRHAAAPSPARKLVSKLARAVGVGGGSSAAAAESWEEF